MNRFAKKDCAAFCLKILGCLCRLRMNYFSTIYVHTQYILFIIKGLSTVLRENIVKILKSYKILKKFNSFYIKFHRDSKTLKFSMNSVKLSAKQIKIWVLPY